MRGGGGRPLGAPRLPEVKGGEGAAGRGPSRLGRVREASGLYLLNKNFYFLRLGRSFRKWRVSAWFGGVGGGEGKGQAGRAGEQGNKRHRASFTHLPLQFSLLISTPKRVSCRRNIYLFPMCLKRAPQLASLYLFPQGYSNG